MAVYSARGFTAATAATANHCVFEVWNPDAAQRVKLQEIGFYWAGVTTTGNPRYFLTRTTAVGTAGSTVTPDADNCWSADIPPSGLTLRLSAFSVQPTLAAPELSAQTMANPVGSEGMGYVWLFPLAPLELPPGRGVAVCQLIAQITPACEVYAVWEEG